MQINKILSGFAVLISVLLCACNNSSMLPPATTSASGTGASGDSTDPVDFPVSFSAAQPTPPKFLLPCILIGTIGLEGSLGQEDNTRPSATGPDVGNGLAANATSNAPVDLPQQVFLRTDTETYNRRYQFVLRDGRVWFKSNTAVTGIQQPWAAVSMPACLAGDVIGISADDDEMIALRSDGSIYGMDNAFKSYKKFNWSSRWGPVFWTGLGYKLPPGYRAWSWTVISPAEDQNWTDPAGNLHKIGNGKCSHIWSLRDDGQHYRFNDPWLPTDHSYEMCGPRRGQFRGVNLSASGSTIFTINRYGDLYTRNYDFDLSGDDSLFFKYSYEDQRGKNGSAIQLPAERWLQQPKIPGEITQNISVEKVGINMEHRILRVEGEDASGYTGYWQKDYHDMDTAHWVFHRTDRPLRGVLLDNRRYDSSLDNAGPSEDALFARNMGNLAELATHPQVTDDDDWAGELTNFNFYCPPDNLRIWFGPDQYLDLILHTTDVIRQLPIKRGLTSTPRSFEGDIEIPADTFAALDSLPAKQRQFIAHYLKNQRFTDVNLSGTRTTITIQGLGWQFKRQ